MRMHLQLSRAQTFGRLLPVSGLSLLLLVTACHDTLDPGVAGTNVLLVVTAVDPSGTPLVARAVAVQAWPTQPAQLVVYTDSLGRAAVSVGQLPAGERLDSLRIVVRPADCGGGPGAELRLPSFSPVSLAEDTIRATLTSETGGEGGRLAVAQFCGAGIGETTPNTQPGVQFSFNLWIDEISDSVRGRYDVVYSYSIGDDWGHFSGVQDGGDLVLTLRSGATGLTCQGQTLRIALDAQGRFGLAHWDPSTCFDFEPFRFEVDSSREWPAQFGDPTAGH